MNFFSLEFLLFSLFIVLVSVPLRKWPDAYKLFLSGASLFYLASWSFASSILVVSLYSLFLLHRAFPVKILRWPLLLLAIGVTFTGKLWGGGYYETSAASHPLFVVGAAFLGLQFYSLIQESCARGSPRAGWIDSLLYLSYFPKSLVGPICRWRNFLGHNWNPALEWKTIWLALFLVTLGIFKNVVLSSRLAEMIKSAAAADPLISLSDLWLLSYLMFFQGYADFSAYVDVAMGISLLLGITLPPNFNLPYLATGPADFWRRWHISFFQWARDYIYYPVFGRTRKMGLAMLAVFLFAGIWHQFHPLVILFFLLSFLTIWLEGRIFSKNRSGWRAPNWIKILLQFHLTCFMFMLVYFWLFREWNPTYTFDLARTAALYLPSGRNNWAIAIAAIMIMVAVEAARVEKRHALAQATAVCFLFFLVVVFFKTESYLFFYIRM